MVTASKEHATNRMSAQDGNSDKPSNTTDIPYCLRQDIAHRSSSSADWNSVKLPTLAEANDMYIRFVLDHCGGNRDATARLLGIGHAALGQHLRRQYFKTQKIRAGADFGGF